MKVTEYYKDFVIEAEISLDNTHIENSYKVKKSKDMRSILERLKVYSNSADALNKISINTMIHEWRAHNLLYALGICRDRTKDVDLNYNNVLIKIAYFILSCMYWQ